MVQLILPWMLRLPQPGSSSTGGGGGGGAQSDTQFLTHWVNLSPLSPRQGELSVDLHFSAQVSLGVSCAKTYPRSPASSKTRSNTVPACLLRTVHKSCLWKRVRRRGQPADCAPHAIVAPPIRTGACLPLPAMCDCCYNLLTNQGPIFANHNTDSTSGKVF